MLIKLLVDEGKINLQAHVLHYVHWGDISSIDKVRNTRPAATPLVLHPVLSAPLCNRQVVQDMDIQAWQDSALTLHPLLLLSMTCLTMQPPRLAAKSA